MVVIARNLDRTALSEGFRADDRGPVRPTGNRAAIRLPAFSGIRGATGSAFFREFTVNGPNVQVASP